MPESSETYTLNTHFYLYIAQFSLTHFVLFGPGPGNSLSGLSTISTNNHHSSIPKAWPRKELSNCSFFLCSHTVTPSTGIKHSACGFRWARTFSHTEEFCLLKDIISPSSPAFGWFLNNSPRCCLVSQQLVVSWHRQALLTNVFPHLLPCICSDLEFPTPTSNHFIFPHSIPKLSEVRLSRLDISLSLSYSLNFCLK